MNDKHKNQQSSPVIPVKLLAELLLLKLMSFMFE